ncbi:potassium channel family protein [Paraclostridium bifermentans]|uniref:potassium channel family protein n=1 Tax=Paraclostridium bifermentans TaxID=1490 RepID=UPI00359C29D1
MYIRNTQKGMDSGVNIKYSNLVINKTILLDSDNISEFNKYKNIKFLNIVFNKDLVFENCKFEKELIFENIKLNGDIYFKNCTFNENCIFKNVEFNKNSSKKRLFIKSKIKCQKLKFEKIKYMPRLDGVHFSHCCKVDLKSIFYEKENYKYAKINYRIAKNQSNIIGDYDKVSHYYYMERYYGGKCIKRDEFESLTEYINTKFIDLIAKYTIGYGEKPLNIFIVSFFIVSIFALLYMITGIKDINDNVIGLNYDNSNNIKSMLKDYLDLWYFSMATFSTVGYGDMVVNNILGKLLVSLEVFFGVTMAASWASVIFRKMSR